MDKILNSVSNSNCWKNIKKINKGFDNCVKYYFEYESQKYIIKIFPKSSFEKKKQEYCILQKIQEYDFIKPKPITMGKIDDDNYYYILTWVKGKTLTELNSKMSNEELYKIGLRIGQIMLILHEEKFNNVDLSSKINKIKNKFELFRALELEYSSLVLDYLENNVEKLKLQPKSIVHGDLNHDNIIIDSSGNVGIIDFGNAAIDYSYQDMHQIQMYNRFLSIPLSRGIIDKYLSQNDNEIFWQSYKIYSAYYSLSKILWSRKFNNKNLEDEMLMRLDQTVVDFNYFKNEKPLWYTEYRNIVETSEKEIC